MEEADHHLNHHQQQQHDHDHQEEKEEVAVGCKEEQNTTAATAPAPAPAATTTTTNNIIIKGKRTKRLRPQSPIPFAIPTNSSTADGGGGGGGECNTTTTNSSSPTSSSAELQESTEVEEDMANCLILLAHGQSRGSPPYSSSHKRLHQPHNDHPTAAATTITSRRFLEATPLSAAVGTAKAAAAGGYYVYECKTCNRTFPSFQALGGHRASHKKPKANMDDQKKQFGIGLLQSDEEDTQLFKNMSINNNNTASSSPLSLHLSNRGLVLSSSNNNKSKVHECSICGAEFTSGQALGGHMRRHRAPVGGPAANTTLALTAPPPPPPRVVPLALEAPQHQYYQQQQQQQQQPLKKQRSMLSLDLDLNLPAPEDDHHHHRDQSKFVFTSKQQQQQQQQQQQPQQQPQQQQQQERLRILVDCHY